VGYYILKNIFPYPYLIQLKAKVFIFLLVVKKRPKEKIEKTFLLAKALNSFSLSGKTAI